MIYTIIYYIPSSYDDDHSSELEIYYSSDVKEAAAYHANSRLRGGDHGEHELTLLINGEHCCDTPFQDAWLELERLSDKLYDKLNEERQAIRSAQLKAAQEKLEAEQRHRAAAQRAADLETFNRLKEKLGL